MAYSTQIIRSVGAALLALTCLPASAKSNCDAPIAQCAATTPDACVTDIAFSSAELTGDAEIAKPQHSPADSCTQSLSVLRECLAAAVRDCGPGYDAPDPAGALSEPLASTVWSGGTSDDGVYVFRFCADGVVDYTSNSGRWKTGRWIRVGDRLIISMNDGYAVYFGGGSSERISGGWINVTDGRATWAFDRDGRPFDGECRGLGTN